MKNSSKKTNLLEKFKKLSNIEKVATSFWIIWVLSVLTFVALVLAVPHPTMKANALAAIRYANILAASGVTVTVLLFVSLSLTVFPKVKWGKQSKGGNN